MILHTHIQSVWTFPMFHYKPILQIWHRKANVLCLCCQKFLTTTALCINGQAACTVKRFNVLSHHWGKHTHLNLILPAYEITTELQYMTNYCTITYMKNILYIKAEYHLHTIGHIFTTNSARHTSCTKHNTSLTSFYYLKLRG